MNNQEILSIVDHTLLSQTATWEEIKIICDDAIHYKTASVCIPPSYVKAVKDYVGDKMKICTVIGFPNGYNTTATKVFETSDAVANGADEIDMVINLGMVKDNRYHELTEEICTIKKLVELGLEKAEAGEELNEEELSEIAGGNPLIFIPIVLVLGFVGAYGVSTATRGRW